MRDHIRYIVFAKLICVLLTVSASAFATGIPFSSDVDAINKAAKSVLMLEVYDANEQMIGSGSGFVAFDNYTLVTNEHVIDGASFIIGKSDDGNQYMLTKLISADVKKDIAILEFFSPTDLTPLSLNDQGDVQRAESVVAIGSPLGHKNSVSLGNISALFEEDEVAQIQFTAPISHGSSGGALFNDKGLVIGITSGFYEEGQNINLAINIEEVLDLYVDSYTSGRTNLSKYGLNASIPTDTTTAKPTVRITPNPTAKPTKTPFPLEGYLNFGLPNKFNYSVLKDYEGYEYDGFEKWWSYSRKIMLGNSFMFIVRLSGDSYIQDPPDILIMSADEKSRGGFVKTIDFLIRDKIYTYENLRYHDDLDGIVFFYLGSIGRLMIEDIPKAKTLSIRMTFENNKQSTFELNSKEFSPLIVWCKNILKNEVFDLFNSRTLFYADNVHNAKVK